MLVRTGVEQGQDVDITGIWRLSIREVGEDKGNGDKTQEGKGLGQV